MRSRFAPTLANNIWKMQAIRLLFWTHFVSSVLVPFFQQWAGLSLTQILLLNAWFMLWNFLLEVPTGTVADFLGRKASVVCGCFLAGIAALTYVSYPHYLVFLFAEILLAAAFTLISGADEALVYDSLDAAENEQDRVDEAKRILARLESFKLIGIIGGAFCGSFIANAWGIEKPVMFQAIPAALAGLIALTLREPPVGNAREQGESYRQVLLGGVRYFVEHPVLRILTTDMVLVTTLSWLVIWLYQPVLERAGVALVFFGVVHAGMSFGQIIVLTQVQRFERWFGSARRFLVGSAVLVGIGFMILGFAPPAPIAIAAILLAASFGLCRPVLFAAYLNQHIPSERRATVLSTISMFRTVAIALINALAGFLADFDLHLTLLVLGVAILILSALSRVQETHLRVDS